MSKKIKYITYLWKYVKRITDLNRIYTIQIRSRFKRLDSILNRKVEIKNPQCIDIGKNVNIQPYTWICAMINDLPRIGVFSPSIKIGDGTTIGRFCQITISNHLTIEDNVLITEGVLITDSIHGYEDVNTPIIKQPLLSKGPIIIGSGSWLCNGARIVGKVKIGKNTVIGANTYIDKDVPSNCIVAGSPARIIKEYFPEANQWVNVNKPLSNKN